MELKSIKGIGNLTLVKLNEENINTIDELLFHYPSSYEIYEVNNEKVFSQEFCTIKGICNSNPIFLKYQRNVYSIIFYINIFNYKLKCILFSSDYLRYKLYKGVEVTLYGRYKKVNNQFVVNKVLFDDFTNKIVVNYDYKNIKSYQVQKIVNNILNMNYEISETMPKALIEKYKLYPIKTLIAKAHNPTCINDIKQIDRRRKYEEFFFYAMSFNILRSIRDKYHKKERIIDIEFLNRFINDIPFELTKDQIKAIEDIKKDILDTKPMNRLIQGDVGCGKSIVSLYAILATISSGYQALLMLPTEILANQQYISFKKYFDKYNLNINILTSSTKNKERKEILTNLLNGNINLLVGTHSLLNEEVKLKNLGLVVIDEQHKFGVNQRKTLIEKYRDVDAIYLSATPIPRTLGLTVFGDLDISSIKSMPDGRIKIDTKIISYNKLKSLIKFLRLEIEKGNQAYVVCPLINKNLDFDAISVEEVEKIFKDELEDINIKTIHSRISVDEKQKIMNEFNDGIIKVLISTTVIEVGVNNPKATMMIIMDANRFGLAQIHQLRGRVGRGNIKSYCALVTNDLENERLKALEEISDGFGIADADFRLRGPGDYFGYSQSGFNDLEYASFELDYKIWECAKSDSLAYLDDYLKGIEKSSKFDQILLDKEKVGIKTN